MEMLLDMYFPGALKGAQFQSPLWGESRNMLQAWTDKWTTLSLDGGPTVYLNTIADVDDLMGREMDCVLNVSLASPTDKSTYTYINLSCIALRCPAGEPYAWHV